LHVQTTRLPKQQSTSHNHHTWKSST
jgi:hypothetical protein